ncbi:MAG: hypothetical protein JXR88_15675 [Clostridia bacterium]|nr:hypothetical protein [Clostridia bacterium]
MKKVKIKLNAWIYKITIATFFITILISYVTDLLMAHTGLILAIFAVLIIILVGVFFDTVGIAVAAGKPEPFHSMAAAKIPSAKYSLHLLKHASKVSNFFNDVIGDIAGIISGAASALIVLKIISLNIGFTNQTVASIIISSIVACLTVGGKALGKEVAINYSKEIVNLAGKIMYLINEKTFIKIIKFK